MSHRSFILCLGLSLSCVPATAEEPARLARDRHGDPLPAGVTARLGTIRFRHAGSVRAVALAGEEIVSVGDDGWTKRWQLGTGKRLSAFRSPLAKVAAAVTEAPAVLSPDGRLVATVAETGDKTDKLVLWETATGKVRAEIKDQRLLTQLSQSCLAFSADGKTLAVASSGNVVSLYDTATGRSIRKLVGESRSFRHLAFSPDGKLLAGVSEEAGAGITLWDARSGALQKAIPVPEVRLAAVAFAPDGKTLVFGSEEGKIQLWSLETGKPGKSFQDKKREEPLSFLFLKYSPDGRLGAIGDVYNTTVLLWDPATGKVVHQIEGIADPHCAAFSADGKTLVTGDSGHLVRLWDVQTGNEKQPFGMPDIVTSPVALSADGKLLATGGAGGKVHLWSYPAGRLRLSVELGARPCCLAFTPRTDLVVVGSDDGQVRFFDPGTGKRKRKFLAHWDKEGEKTEPCVVRSLAISPDGKLLATGGFDSVVRLWEVESGKQLHAWNDRKGWVFAVAFSPDGKTVVGGGCSDASMSTCLWDVKSGKLVRRLEENPADALAFSRRGDQLVTAGGLFGAWWVTFVDPKSGEDLASFKTKKGDVPDAFLAAAVSPNGRTLALGSARGIALWDMTARKVVRRIEGEFGACASLAFAPDGRTLVAGHGDGTVLFWDVSGQAAGRP